MGKCYNIRLYVSRSLPKNVQVMTLAHFIARSNLLIRKEGNLLRFYCKI